MLTQIHLAERNYTTLVERGFFSQKLSWALSEDHLPTLVLQSVKTEVPTNKPDSDYFWTAGLCCFWHRVSILTNAWWHVRWRPKHHCSPTQHRTLLPPPKAASQRPEAASTLQRTWNELLPWMAFLKGGSFFKLTKRKHRKLVFFTYNPLWMLPSHLSVAVTQLRDFTPFLHRLKPLFIQHFSAKLLNKHVINLDSK